MNVQPIQLIVLHGTVRDLMRVYPFASADTQDKMFDLIRGASNPDQEIRLQVRDQAQADEIMRFSRFAEAPLGSVQVTSRSRPGLSHTIYYKGGVPIACSCEAFQFSHTETCRHMKEATLRGIQPQHEGTIN